MKKLVVLGAGAVAAAAASLTLISQADATPDQSGQTYAEAKAALTQAGYSVEVSSSFGDKLPQDECKVVRQQATAAAPFTGGGWAGAANKPRILLSLDCSQPK